MKSLDMNTAEDFLNRNPTWIPVRMFAEDVEWVKKNAKLRNNHGKSKGWTSKTSDTKDTWNEAGLAGELAASLYYEVPIRTVLGYNKQQLNEGDLGDMIEVKTSRYSDPTKMNLVVNEDHLKPERAYVLCLTCLFPEYVIVVGWAWGHEILKKGRKTVHTGTGHSIYLMNRNLLKSPESLKSVIKKEPS